MYSKQCFSNKLFFFLTIIDWICYGILDDITDSFAPLIKSIEFEVDSIDELVLILKESEQSDMLRRIGYCRKRVMGLLRLLVSKSDVVKTLIKRGETKPEEATRPEFSTEVSLFLGDVHGNKKKEKEKGILLHIDDIYSFLFFLC
jgi:Mg2+ and Co2+ transporter CorA